MTQRPFRTRRRGEGGAVLVETAMILPMLLIIALAVFDLGLAWRSSMTVDSAARAAARVGSNLGVDWAADREALLSLRAAIGAGNYDKITKVVIYKSSTPNGDPHPTCLSTTSLSSGGNSGASCNVYRGGDLHTLSAANFPSSCTQRHRFWCPSSRVTAQSAVDGPDFLGVYVEMAHPTLTKVFGQTMTIKGKAVMQIEPNAGGS